MSAEYHLVLITGAVFLVAGAVKGVTGMGLPTVAMGLLGSLISPTLAASLLLIPSLVTNLFQLGWGRPLWLALRRLAPMQVMVVAGTLAASGWISQGSNPVIRPLLGAALVVYALWSLAGRQFVVTAQAERLGGPVIGLITGLITGASGIFVMPAVPWLQSLALDKARLVQALGVSFTSSTLALAAGMAWHGALNPASLGASTLAVLPALAGMWLGQWARDRLSLRVFRLCFLVCLAGLGAEMLLSHS